MEAARKALMNTKCITRVGRTRKFIQIRIVPYCSFALKQLFAGKCQLQHRPSISLLLSYCHELGIVEMVFVDFSCLISSVYTNLSVLPGLPFSTVPGSMASPHKSSSRELSAKTAAAKEPVLASKPSKVTKQKINPTTKRVQNASGKQVEQAANQPGRWDDWVPQERLRKLTEDNLQLAKQLKKEVEQLQKQPRPDTKKSGGQKRKGGESARGTSSPVPQIVNKKRGRDLETEKVFASLLLEMLQHRANIATGGGVREYLPD